MPLAAQIAAGFTPAGLAADVATAAKYGRDAVRNVIAGQYGEAAAPAILAALAGVGLIPIVGDIAKSAGSKLVRSNFDTPSNLKGLEEMGMDTSTVMYHGTGNPNIEEFVPGGLSGSFTSGHGTGGLGTWMSDSPGMASQFAKNNELLSGREGMGASPNVMPLYRNRGNPLVFLRGSDKKARGLFNAAQEKLDNFAP